jgi:ATP phosphoribosyltransferase regulatory subunit
MAAVRGLRTTDARKSALLRHIWRPRRFRSLLDRYAGRVKPSKERKALIDGEMPICDAPLIGKRRLSEIEHRIALLRADAAELPVSAIEVDLLDALLNVREMLPFAQQHLSDLAVDMPSISDAVDRLSMRMDALAAHGINVDELPFEANYGRTSMEYYDGFVFGLYCAKRPDLPPIATGGRYDALTRRLGGNASIPAVGGVIRPDLVVQLEGQE